MEIKTYDKKNDRIVFYNKKANVQFWEEHWRENIGSNQSQKIADYKNNRFILKIVKNYLDDKNSWILEGGCGIGGYVYCLQHAGYNVVGIDNAEKTVKAVKECYPDLNIQRQDVRKTSFEDNYFSIYFSFGVIEHFYKGYDEILSEAVRIIKPGGYLIISFPQLSILRRIKAELGLYARDKPVDKEHFYQFALNPEKVIKGIEQYGFQLVKKSQYDGIKGFKDEVAIFRPFLQAIYDGKILQILRRIIDIILKGLSSHMALLVMQKK